jgi:glycosyltransferase involved in cell wall biosynthesis
MIPENKVPSRNGLRMRQIDHVVDSLDVGGAERLVVLLAQHQRRHGAHVRVHTLFGLGALAEPLRADGVEIIEHGARPQRLDGIGSLTKALRRQRPDAVHCHNISATLVGAPAAALARVPACLATRHGWARRDGAWRAELKFSIAARACSRVVAVCEAARRELAAAPLARPSRIVTIVNGAEAPRPTRESRAPADRCVVVSVARLNWAKDHGTLLRAVAAARQQRPEIELHLVGDGPERSRLEGLADSLGIRSAVQFLGERDDIGDCLSDAHAFVLSSVTEGLPVALLEALAMGLTPIVSDVGGMPEVVGQAGVGTVFPAGDVARLGAALVDLATARDRWPAWAAAARSAFERHYTISRMCTDYDALLSRCVSE